MNRKILLVDDDENVLDGYKRNLRNHFQVLSATSGLAALGILKQVNDIAIVVSDFKMPAMTGIEFLKFVKDVSPNSVRILLTGYADSETAINAVNESNIFRLLTKPCNPERLLMSLNDAYKQYELIVAEKELLEQTLKGSIKILVDILSIVNPEAFQHAGQMVNLAKNIAYKFGIKDTWRMEIATLLSQIGCVAIPQDIIKKKFSGDKLSSEELTLFNSHPAVGFALLKNIPRLEEIANIVKDQFVSECDGSPIKKESKILNVLNNYFLYSAVLQSPRLALKKLKDEELNYDRDILVALDAELAGIYEGLKIISIPFSGLEVGHVLADDIRDGAGTVLITKGAEISEIMKLRLVNYQKVKELKEPLKIFS